MTKTQDKLPGMDKTDTPLAKAVDVLLDLFRERQEVKRRIREQTASVVTEMRKIKKGHLVIGADEERYSITIQRGKDRVVVKEVRESKRALGVGL